MADPAAGSKPVPAEVQRPAPAAPSGIAHRRLMTAALTHRLVGVLGVLAFLATGVYLVTGFPELHGDNAGIRYQFRANHVYILLASLANWLLGIHLRSNFPGWRLAVQRLGTAMLLVAPAVLVAAFFIEPPRGSPERPLTTLGIVLLLAGTVLQAVAKWRQGRVR
jgi:hypothetical protein